MPSRSRSLSLERPADGPRASGRVSGSELLAPDYINLLHTFAQAVWDVRRTLEWVRTTS